MVSVILYSRGLLGQNEIKTNGSADGACSSSTRHSSASARIANDIDAEISDIFDESWLESTVKVDEHRSSGTDEMREKRSSTLYKYVPD